MKNNKNLGDYSDIIKPIIDKMSLEEQIRFLKTYSGIDFNLLSKEVLNEIKKF